MIVRAPNLRQLSTLASGAENKIGINKGSSNVVSDVDLSKHTDLRHDDCNWNSQFLSVVC